MSRKLRIVSDIFTTTFSLFIALSPLIVAILVISFLGSLL